MSSSYDELSLGKSLLHESYYTTKLQTRASAFFTSSCSDFEAELYRISSLCGRRNLAATKARIKKKFTQAILV